MYEAYVSKHRNPNSKGRNLAELFSSTSLWRGALSLQNVIISFTNCLKTARVQVLICSDAGYNIQLSPSDTGDICLCLYLVYTFFPLSPSLCSALSSSLHLLLSLFLCLFGGHCAGRPPRCCSDPKEGPAEEGYGFHKALSSINVSRSTFSTWLNIIPAGLW